MLKIKISLILLISITFIVACTDVEPEVETGPTYPAVGAKFANTIDLENLANYANQTIPDYITQSNERGNTLTDAGATLGRVLFYDKMLSSDGTIACASCHQQSLAFGDSDAASIGVNGSTGRHSMRLVNAGFSEEVRFFWDERAATLEEQTTQPIQDHAEMGYSGENGDETLEDLIVKMQATDYYQELFSFVFGDETITEERMQDALSQFIRSITSFDSKYDIGRADAVNDNAPFSNFTADENAGKALFIGRPTFDNTGVRTAGGAGCQGCHRAPEFDIDPGSRNNGIIGVIGGGATDETNTKSPTLRDVVNSNGGVNGLLMHNANFGAIQGVLAHYNSISAGNANLDPRLNPQGNLQQLNLTATERSQLASFINTLTGTDVYTNAKWSDPFE